MYSQMVFIEKAKRFKALSIFMFVFSINSPPLKKTQEYLGG